MRKKSITLLPALLFAAAFAVPSADAATVLKRPTVNALQLSKSKAVIRSVKSLPALRAVQTKQKLQLRNNGSIKALNPQPLPPGPAGMGQQKALNPQPLPPGPADMARMKALNPQPLPPGPAGMAQQKALNPQPLPPGPDKTVGRATLKTNAAAQVKKLQSTLSSQQRMMMGR